MSVGAIFDAAGRTCMVWCVGADIRICSRVFVHRNATQCPNVVRRGDLIIYTDVLDSGQKFIWKLTGATFSENPNYLEAKWPD